MMKPIALVMSIAVLCAAGCVKKGQGNYDDEPRASKEQCDYAGVHVKGLKVGKALDDGEQAAWRQTPEYATFMEKCPSYSSMGVQCLIDAQTVDAMSACK